MSDNEQRQLLLRIGFAVSLASAGQFRQAERILRDCLAADPDLWVTHGALSFCQTQMGDPESGLESARTALRLAPNESNSHAAAGWALLALEDFEGAESEFRIVIQNEPGDAGGWAMLARVLNRQDRLNEALDAAQTGIEQDPEDTDCLMEKSYAESLLGRSADAAATTDALLAVGPDEPHAHMMATVQALLEGNSRRAAVHSEEVVRQAPARETQILVVLAEWIRFWMIRVCLKSIAGLRFRRFGVFLVSGFLAFCAVPLLLGFIGFVHRPFFWNFQPLFAVLLIAFLAVRLEEPVRTTLVRISRRRELIPVAFLRESNRTLILIPAWIGLAIAWGLSEVEDLGLSVLAAGLSLMPISSVLYFNARSIRLYGRFLNATVVVQGLGLLLATTVGLPVSPGMLHFCKSSFPCNVLMLQAYHVGVSTLR